MDKTCGSCKHMMEGCSGDNWHHSFKVGDKVTRFGQKGIVKAMSDAEHVFVVYNCDGNWEEYADYTAARTNVAELKKGWSW